MTHVFATAEQVIFMEQALEHLSKPTNNGELYDFEDFQAAVEDGIILDEDGVGYYAMEDGSFYRKHPIELYNDLNPLFPKILWFSK